jgi:putative flippase GtrA
MARLSSSLHPRREASSMLRFLAVGALGTAIDMALFAPLHGILGSDLASQSGFLECGHHQHFC